MDDILFILLLALFLFTAIQLMDDGDGGGRRSRIPA